MRSAFCLALTEGPNQLWLLGASWTWATFALSLHSWLSSNLCQFMALKSAWRGEVGPISVFWQWQASAVQFKAEEKNLWLLGQFRTSRKVFPRKSDDSPKLFLPRLLLNPELAMKPLQTCPRWLHSGNQARAGSRGKQGDASPTKAERLRFPGV